MEVADTLHHLVQELKQSSSNVPSAAHELSDSDDEGTTGGGGG